MSVQRVFLQMDPGNLPDTQAVDMAVILSAKVCREYLRSFPECDDRAELIGKVNAAEAKAVALSRAHERFLSKSV
jgi:hypothetical protein